MPQETYQRILLGRTHSRHRCENKFAEVAIDELDAQEIRRTIQTGIAGGRLAADISADDLTERPGQIGTSRSRYCEIVRSLVKMLPVCATQLHGSNPANEELGGVERALGATVPEAAGEDTAQAYIDRQALLPVVFDQALVGRARLGLYWLR